MDGWLKSGEGAAVNEYDGEVEKARLVSMGMECGFDADVCNTCFTQLVDAYGQRHSRSCTTNELSFGSTGSESQPGYF